MSKVLKIPKSDMSYKDYKEFGKITKDNIKSFT